ncbi:hypothetical protein B0H13DRAFT_1885521 [Mycena leptocephala]|nr:hypothetical protein B0H13DRAFT_1885521 [Mycena leptocephala]
MSSITTTSSSSRPSFSRSKTMPAFRRALSLSSVDKFSASLRASSSKSLQRMSSFGKASNSPATSSAFASTESIPVFTVPDYTNLVASSPSVWVSPLTRRSLKHAGAQEYHTCERNASDASVASTHSVASVKSSLAVTSTSTRRRRSSSVSSVESFSSTEDRVTLALRMCALPSTITGLLTSILSVLLILFLPAMTTQTLKRKPAQRNPPSPPPLSTISSRFSRRITKAYHRTVHRATRARRASTPGEALAAFFAPTPKRVRAKTPVTVDPKTLVSDIPLMVYSSPIALPLPMGRAPAVRPVRKNHKFTAADS